MKSKRQQDIGAILDLHTPLSLHEQLVIERVGGYRALGMGPLEVEALERQPYDRLYQKMKRSAEGV